MLIVNRNLSHILLPRTIKKKDCMCGIVAIFSKREPISGEALARATQRLYHRGPDEQRQWIAPHGRVGLGHTRLSIIDLETGAQPIGNEDGTVQIVVNGEFYDFERIQCELTQRGHCLRTRSDSEIALHLYEDFGAQCLRDLRGEFAFVLWDESNQLLLAARDRFGMKPLFYSVVEDTLYLASEVKALFAAGVPRGWDHESVFQHLFVSVDQDRSLFEGVYQVPPGHYLLATRGRIQLVRYWDLDYPRENHGRPARSDAEYIEQLQAALNEAVRIRLRADVPVACLLSGGLDSSAVLGMAAQHCTRPPEAFTVAFDHPVYDEGPFARETASHLGAEFHPLPVNSSDLAAHFSDAVWHGEMLSDNAHGVARYLLSRAVRDAGFKVVLSGEGADELFAGYLFARQDVVSNSSQKQEQPVPRQPGRAPRNIPGQVHSLAGVHQMLGFTPSMLKTLAKNRSPFCSLLETDFAAEFGERDPYCVFLNRLDIQGQLSGRERVIQSLYLWNRSIFASVILAAERLDMAHSIEVRLPFLDHKLFELVRELPVSLLIHGLTEKYVLREATRPFVTDTVYRAPKHPFIAPPASVTTNERLYELLQDVLRSQVMRSVPFFDHASVVGLLDKLPKMDQYERMSLDPVLMMLLCICFLQDRFSL
jgi:asparagine synthase (glutamine-hydrolysing)